MLHYTSDAGVSGSGTFSVPVRCHFNRFHYSYKIGFVPSVGKLKYFKPMKTKGSVTLTACDAQWNKLAPAEGFIIGQPMFFQAETLHVAENQRLFVHFCHVTANSSRDSTPHVNIINNYGCLMDSRRSRSSRFINSSERNVVRFTIDAFVLQERVQKYLFIHCEMSIRNSVPTETSKSCSYNLQEKRWEELYGVHSVCSCCGSSCIPETTLTQPVTSELTTVVQRHPQEKSRITPTHSSEGTFTPKPEEEILPTGRDDAASEHRLGTVTLTPDSESGIVTQETDHGEITLQREPTPETYTGPLSPHSTRPTPTPDGEQGVPDREQVVWTPDSSEQGLATSDGEQGGPDREQGGPAPDSEHGKITPEGGASPESEHGLPTPDSEQKIPMADVEHGKITPEGAGTEEEHRSLTQAHEDGSLMLDHKQGVDLVEAPPTMESRDGSPDTEHRHVTPNLQEQGATLAPSAGQNLISPVYKYTEPYRIFEEVFGIS